MISMSRRTRADLTFGYILAGAIVAGAAIVRSCTGCAPVPSATPLTAAGYEAEQLACVVEAGTREQADECRCVVQARYGRNCTGYTTLDKLDAGGGK